MNCHNATWVRHCFGSIEEKMECTGRELFEQLERDKEQREAMQKVREMMMQQQAAAAAAAAAAAGGAAAAPGGGNVIAAAGGQLPAAG